MRVSPPSHTFRRIPHYRAMHGQDVTPDLLRAATGCSVALSIAWAQPLSYAMSQYGITTPARSAAFLAQTGHESEGFEFVREIWGPTAEQLRYEGNADLGNTQPGDGHLFLGRGPLDITGRANYLLVAEALCLDCVAHPEMLEVPAWGALSAAWWWNEHGLNALADQQLFSAITRRINGGLNGNEDRLARYHTAWAALNPTSTPEASS